VRLQSVPKFGSQKSPGRHRAGLKLVGTIALVSVIGSASLSGCTAGSSNASVISGKLAPTNEKELQAELDMLTAIPEFRTDWKAKSQFHEDAHVGKKYSPELVGFVLGGRYFRALVNAESVARKIKPAKVTPEMRSSVESATPGGALSFKKYPKAYQDALLLSQQNLEALLLSAGGDPKAYFEKHKADFAKACIRHILVKTEPEALAAIKRIKGGEDFAKVATISDDPGSKVKGGDLGCQGLAGYVPEFAKAGGELKVGELSAPVKSQFGYHVMLVYKRDEPKWSPEIEQEVKPIIQQAGVEDIKTALVKRGKEAGTVVNPQFGVLDMTSGPIPQISMRPKPGTTTVPALPDTPQG
jgi:PPIC-type PPIASE domain